jgi:hypothetical protein
MEKLSLKSDYQILIYEIRGLKVMLDHDLAFFYGIETKRLKEQVKRNRSRFPEDFMFELNQDEFQALRPQFATSKRGGIRYMPMAFTEQGVAMLSTVLNSDRAIQVNIEIMRAFVRYRTLLVENMDFNRKLTELDEKIDQVFQYLLERIDALREDQVQIPARKIGFRRAEEET